MHTTKKKLSEDDLKQLRARFNIPVDDAGIRDYAFVQPEPDNPVVEHLRTKRAALGGSLPWRRQQSTPLAIPDLSILAPLLASSEQRAKYQAQWLLYVYYPCYCVIKK